MKKEVRGRRGKLHTRKHLEEDSLLRTYLRLMWVRIETIICFHLKKEW